LGAAAVAPKVARRGLSNRKGESDNPRVSIQVTSGAALMCTFGTTPSTLTAIPQGTPVQAGGAPAATIQDNKPTACIPPFGMCITPSNPTVAAATAAAMGTLTPQPCIPMTSAPWMPGSSTVLINGQPALNATSTCMCQWGGVISITAPGSATTVLIP
jgi:hypothetical protein